jgi:hypothetical protein
MQYSVLYQEELPMKRIILALALLCGLTTTSFAACPSPVTGKDAGGTTQNFGTVVDGSGNCWGGNAIVDGTAAANKATVDSNGNVHIDETTGSQFHTDLTAPIVAGTNLIGNTGQVYPAGSTPITASATGTTTATTATLAANASLHTYICGFSIRANATAAATNNATVTGTVTGTLNFTQWTAPLASGLGVTEEVFSPCVISSAVNTGVAVVSGAPGSGGVVSVSAWGYQL